MGQQQLLLLVIGVVLVGLAVVAGFEAVQIKIKQSDADTLVDRCLTIASDAVFWRTKTAPYHGGNLSYAQLETGGMQQLFLGEEIETGSFRITRATENELEITAVSRRHPEVGVRVTVVGYDIDRTETAFNGDIALPE